MNGDTFTYSYDEVGNLLTATDYIGAHSYTYGDAQWKDLLTAYDGNAITYDAIGNPTLWYDSTSFTWDLGRRLMSASNSITGLNSSYTYDADGLRLTKTVNGVEHKYVWQGGRLVSEYYDGKELEFFYDESGAPYALSYKSGASAAPVMYYYVTNLQGDVVRLLDSSGSIKASYAYSAWGKLIDVSGDMADINPLRYRGYYYDADTDLYCIGSRYYDPQICRFINADELASTGQGIIGTNMFAYCLNNPVNMADSNGYIPFFIVTGVIGALAGGLIGYATTGTWRGALTGASIGGVVGLTGGAVASKLIVGTAGPVTASTWQQAEQALQNAYEGAKKAVNTPFGQRVIDSATGYIARESKYGYQGLSSFIKQEIMKDTYLKAQGYVVEWHFYWSQISNTGGPSGLLYQALEEAGIKIILHY